MVNLGLYGLVFGSLFLLFVFAGGIVIVNVTDFLQESICAPRF